MSASRRSINLLVSQITNSNVSSDPRLFVFIFIIDNGTEDSQMLLKITKVIKDIRGSIDSLEINQMFFFLLTPILLQR
jgi:hypothetical protein